MPLPPDWNGPPKLSLIGPLTLLDPVGLIVSARLMLPLSILWLPSNVSLSRLAASWDELALLLPHAATATDARQASSNVLSAPDHRIL